MDIGKLEQVDISSEAKKAYLDYAMSVIVSRALPDIRDGLKPVHRRVLFAMSEMNLAPSAKYAKSAKIVGETMGKYHPHGDMSIYDSLVRLAQDFSMRYPLVDGQGNFGSMDGDSAAAMRYTEAKLTPLAMEMLFDIDKETVEFGDNFDGTMKEPVYLPSKLPNLLLMGSEGIAVGMATKIPPHNLGEVINAVIHTIDKTTYRKDDLKTIETEALISQRKEETDSDIAGIQPENLSSKLSRLSSTVEVDELLEFVKGPDFPTGGAIYDIAEIRNVYRTGRGRILIRGIANIEEIGQGKSAIIITELPYQVNKASLVAKIAELAKLKKLEGITDLRDESDRSGIRVVVELKRDTTPKRVLNNLFKLTTLQTSFPANCVALVDGVPKTVNLKIMLDEYIKHRFAVVTRRSEFELAQAKARIHILDGLIIAVNNIDEVVKIIRESKNTEEARANLIERFKLSEIQANAILDMQLRRLSALEVDKLQAEWEEVKKVIDYLEALLADPIKLLGVVKDELVAIKEKYQDPRRTKVYKSKVDEFSEEDLIQNEQTVITITETGYIKRQSVGSFKTQARGGKGVMGMKTKEEDNIEHISFAETHDFILFFTNLGKVYATRVFEIAEGSRVAKGQAIVNLIDISQGEKIESMLTYNPKAKSDAKYIFLATRKGTVKKTSIEDFNNIRRNGIIAIKLDKNDQLTWVRLTSGEDDIVLVTKKGKIISFKEDQVRQTGRSSQGVRGIKIASDDEVVSMDIVNGGDRDAELLVVAENGLGKRTKVSAVRNQNRGGQGVKIANLNAKTGDLIFSSMIPKHTGEVIITSKKGQVVRIPIKSVPVLSRNAQGVILMRFTDKTEKVGSAALVVEETEIPTIKE
jgi:DNA gyrase subunit A